MSGTGGVDASIALQAKAPVPPNPLATIGQFANTANSLNELKLFPGQLQQQGIATQNQQLGLQQNINRAGYQAIAPILAMPRGTITHSAFTTALASAENNLGIPTSGILQDVMATAPSGDGVDFDQKIRSLVASRAQEGGGAAVAQVSPAAGPNIPFGGAGTGLPNMIQPTTVNPAGLPDTGVVSAAGKGFPLGLSPGEAAQPVPGDVVPAGRPNAGAQTLQPLGSSPFVNGGRMFPVPGALRNPNAPTAATPSVTTTLGTAQAAAESTRGPQSQTAFQNISDQAATARSQAAILDTMLGDTTEFTPGAGAGGIKDFQNAVQRVFGTDGAKAFGIDPKSVAAHESFDKFANQLADAQGAGSDARLAVNQHANPAATNTPPGVDFIIRQLRGNTDYLRAQAQLAASYPDKTDIQGFQTRVANNLDPRVFQFARMTPEQQKSFYNAQQNKGEFQRAWNFAEANKLLPQLQATPAPAPAPVAPVAPTIPNQ
jgi:hypothetical protein